MAHMNARVLQQQPGTQGPPTQLPLDKPARFHDSFPLYDGVPPHMGHRPPNRTPDLLGRSDQIK